MAALVYFCAALLQLMQWCCPRVQCASSIVCMCARVHASSARTRLASSIMSTDICRPPRGAQSIASIVHFSTTTSKEPLQHAACSMQCAACSMQHATCNINNRHHNDVRQQHFPRGTLCDIRASRCATQPVTRACVPPGRDRVASSSPTAHASRRCHWPSATG
jgi:hypothetical protein